MAKNVSDLLKRTCEIATEFLDGVGDRPVAHRVDFAALLANMGGDLPLEGEDVDRVIEQLWKTAEPGLVATVGPRYFGFVVGGSLPAALAADWLTSTWDQNGGLYVLSPAAAAAELVAGSWLIDLFGLAKDSSVGFVTGGTMANFTALAAARHALFHKLDWDVEEQGLLGAPEITVVANDESHVSIFASLQMLGLGRDRVVRVPADEQGRMRPVELQRLLAAIHTPVLVCAQAGNVNTGAFDPLPEIAACIQDYPAWLHVDGAFGLWAAASPRRQALAKGLELADSVSVDCHKWLNVPYDSGVVFVRDDAAHYAAMTLNAPYYVTAPGAERDNSNWVPEASRRARGFTIFAALRSLGKKGIAELVERGCRLAQQMGALLAQGTGVQILNDVVLNQVLVRFTPPGGGDADGFTAAVIKRVQEDGTCWLGGTTWHGMRAMRIAVSNWSTTGGDIEMSAAAILRCAKAAAEDLSGETRAGASHPS
jgi:glutamate/tyrosine decarboxylase-like PLP-dependent enzyme